MASGRWGGGRAREAGGPGSAPPRAALLPALGCLWGTVWGSARHWGPWPAAPGVQDEVSPEAGLRAQGVWTARCPSASKVGRGGCSGHSAEFQAWPSPGRHREGHPVPWGGQQGRPGAPVTLGEFVSGSGGGDICLPANPATGPGKVAAFCAPKLAPWQSVCPGRWPRGFQGPPRARVPGAAPGRAGAPSGASTLTTGPRGCGCLGEMPTWLELRAAPTARQRQP